MKTVCIGIQVYEQPEGLHATLESVQRTTASPVELILLPDGPDAATARALSALAHLPQLATMEPRGAAACFNRLATASNAEVLVLLESGSITGPGWLDHLLAALEARPNHGLAGPTTNRCWNEQGAFPRAGGFPAEVERTARLAHQRFGDAWQPLEPLHSLADFCYAVRREVVDAIGAADEAYGLGPCWEMDYNIRAARAGYRGVWACAAYVWRAPFTPRRRREEQQRFTAGKQRYQDKFCGQRLRGLRGSYKPHCRGDACEHFAPAGLIRLHLPLTAVQAATTAPARAGESPVQPDLAQQTPLVQPVREVPLVSCVMPTGNRADYVVQSIRYLQRQDLRDWELIIVDDGQDNLSAQLPEDYRIRYERVRPGLSIGAKRNHACSLARGEFIAQWDDDDWYGPARLSRQAGPLLAGQADITGLNDTIFFELDKWLFWRCTPALHRRLFVEDVHGGTLMYRRSVWRDFGGYPDRSLAEDAFFLRQAMRRGARLERMSGDGLYLYLRHGSNSWAFTCGQYLDRGGWQKISEPFLPPEDRQFFAARCAGVPVTVGSTENDRRAPAAPAGDQWPLVSCIMPTADRRRFAGQAIAYFLRQDYAARELIIVDDGADPIEDLVPDDPRIRYLRLPKRLAVGAKRNRACEAAHGQIIAHWDDDDWMASWRLHYQVACLLRDGADINGLDRVFYLDPRAGQAWQYVYPPGARPWVAGNTLCYRRTFWQRNPFPEIDVGEDSRFVWSHPHARLAALDDPSFFVGLIHPANVSPKHAGGSRWQPGSIAEVRAMLGEDWGFYAQPDPVRSRQPLT